ncbi:hypothetical protein [Methanosarcina siciliae]|uniref:hypothetical protein n=1 Tax=Methanosarcina siciliae TaxID=38027 RepID=UPI0018CEF47E|nr:hypothetical protein [Methanosarcina siciliae]
MSTEATEITGHGIRIVEYFLKEGNDFSLPVSIARASTPELNLGTVGKHCEKLVKSGILERKPIEISGKGGGLKYHYKLITSFETVKEIHVVVTQGNITPELLMTSTFYAKAVPSLVDFLENEMENKGYQLYETDKQVVKSCLRASPEVLRFVLHPDSYVKMSSMPEYMNFLDMYKYRTFASGIFKLCNLGEVDKGTQIFLEWLKKAYEIYYKNHAVLRVFERLLELDFIRCNLDLSTYEGLMREITTTLESDPQTQTSISILLDEFGDEYLNIFPSEYLGALENECKAEYPIPNTRMG